MRALWTCPRCGRSFANRNQSHFCSDVTLDSHLARCDTAVVETFRRLREAAERAGPFKILPEKTRIAFQVRMSFAAFTLHRHWIDGHVVLAHRRESERFRRVQVVSPRNQVHQFRLHDPAEVDAEVESWLAEAYEVGCQRHLSATTRSAPRPHGS